MAFFFGRSFYSWFFLDVSTFDSFVFIMYSVGVNEPPGPPNIARCIPLKGHGEGLLNVRQDFLRIIRKKAKIHTEDLRRKWFRVWPGEYTGIVCFEVRVFHGSFFVTYRT